MDSEHLNLAKRAVILAPVIVLTLTITVLLSCNNNKVTITPVSPVPLAPSSPTAPLNPSSPAGEEKTIKRTLLNTNITVDHTNWNWFTKQAKQVSDRVSLLRIYFSHASIGQNIMSGFATLHGADPSKYPLDQQEEKDSPPAQTKKGMIYENPRGNPDWPVKLTLFEDNVRDGWRYPKVDISMNKFCYIDQDADLKAYLNSMAALEERYPDTYFVYFSMPLSTGKDSEAARRSRFNSDLRNWITTQTNKLFYDLADIESTSPAGASQKFPYNGTTYTYLYPGYTYDGGHLNSEASERAAIGLYSLFGQLTNIPGMGP